MTRVIVQCDQPNGYVANSDDCDDNDPTITPNTLWYLDNDGDGYGDVATTIVTCVQPGGYTQDNTDCDDSNASYYPGQTWYADADADGYGDPTSTTDCLPYDPSDVLNGDDCDDTRDDLTPNTLWYADCDGDAYFGARTVTQCAEPVTAVCTDGFPPLGGWQPDSSPEDCDDTDALQNPSTLWYADTDVDGFGDGLNIAHIGCIGSYTGSDDIANNGDDCDDTTSSISPDADEYCNGVDDDCDGKTDEKSAVDALHWQGDCDADGYPGEDVIKACTPGNNHTTCADGDSPDGGWQIQGPGAIDCDDEDPTINPTTIWWPDADGDGFGDTAGTYQTQCEAPGE